MTKPDPTAAAPTVVNFAEIKRRRESLGLTLQAAAEAAGRTEATARQWWSTLESGRYPDPQISKLAAAAKALQCRVQDLLHQPDTDFTPPRRKAPSRKRRA